jgi:hypothetical protein
MAGASKNSTRHDLNEVGKAIVATIVKQTRKQC